MPRNVRLERNSREIKRYLKSQSTQDLLHARASEGARAAEAEAEAAGHTGAKFEATVVEGTNRARGSIITGNRAAIKASAADDALVRGVSGLP